MSCEDSSDVSCAHDAPEYLYVYDHEPVSAIYESRCDVMREWEFEPIQQRESENKIFAVKCGSNDVNPKLYEQIYSSGKFDRLTSSGDTVRIIRK